MDTDISYEVIKHLAPVEIYEFCKANEYKNRYWHQLCRNKAFWLEVGQLNFPEVHNIILDHYGNRTAIFYNKFIELVYELYTRLTVRNDFKLICSVNIDDAFIKLLPKEFKRGTFAFNYRGDFWNEEVIPSSNEYDVNMDIHMLRNNNIFLLGNTSSDIGDKKLYDHVDSTREFPTFLLLLILYGYNLQFGDRITRSFEDNAKLNEILSYILKI